VNIWRSYWWGLPK